MLTLEFLRDLALRHQEHLRTPVAEFEIGGRKFEFNSRPAIMGVINLSADSWYRESVCLSVEAAVGRGRVLQAQGAHFVDLGAESTLGHAARADTALQNSKLLPVTRELRASGVLVSVETYDAAVAEAALKAGASVLNLTGTRDSDVIYRLARDHNAAVIVCYVQGPNVREVGDFDFTADPIAAMELYFARELERATKAGAHKIILDPGLGFYYKNLQDSSQRIGYQLRTFLETFRLRKLGQPICHALPHAFEVFGEEVRSAEPFFAVLAALGQTSVFRTHEVARIKAVLETLALV